MSIPGEELHTLVSMTRALGQLAADGVAVEEEILASLSPYQTEHINRFGNYTLDFTRIPAPLPADGQVATPVPVQGLLSGVLSGHV